MLAYKKPNTVRGDSLMAKFACKTHFEGVRKEKKRDRESKRGESNKERRRVINRRVLL